MLSLSKQLLLVCLVVTSLAHAQVPALLKDIRLGTGNSNPGELTVVGNIVFFEANDNVNGSTLWKTDGTPEWYRNGSATGYGYHATKSS